MNLQSLLNKSILELKPASSTPELDARILLENVIKKDSSFIFSHPEHLITHSQYSRFRSCIRRRKKGEPVAYILGEKEFYGHNFIVNKNVLVPRPETEWLVERGIEFLKNYQPLTTNHQLDILDMGTGSGCIIISIVKNLLSPNSQLPTPNYFASDISPKALKIARKNATLNNVKNIKFYISDLFSNRFLHKKFDLIIANLPYVPHHQIVGSQEHGVRSSISFEPQNAIFADDDGMAVIKKFLIQAKKHINESGLILIEADCRNAKKVFEFSKKQYPTAKIELKKDLAGLDRYVIINA